MFGIFMSALNAMLGFVLRGALLKFIAFTVLFMIVTEFVKILVTMLPTGAGLSSAFVGIGAGVWYFLDLFAVSTGVPMILAAFATRFIIRRLPVIG
jgi:hypothetical protein